MRVEAEDRTAHEVPRSFLDKADVEIAVLDGTGEIAVLKRRPHRGVLTLRYAAAKDEALGATAHTGEQRAHHDVVAGRFRQRNIPYLAVAGGAEPEGACGALHR